MAHKAEKTFLKDPATGKLAGSVSTGDKAGVGAARAAALNGDDSSDTIDMFDEYDEGVDAVAAFVVPAVELAFKEGSSDKFYRTFAVGSDCVVQYGKAGTYGQWQHKPCSSPEEAAQMAAKQADAKFKKGYNQTKVTVLQFDSAPSDSQLDAAMGRAPAGDTSAAAPRERPSAVVAGGDHFVADPAIMDALIADGIEPNLNAGPEPVRPMLAEIVNPEDLDRLLDNPRWAAQLKYDGDRFVVEVVNGQVSVYGRNGQAKQRDVNAAMLEPFRHLTEGRWCFDGEMVGRDLVLFDITAAGDDISDMPFDERDRLLRSVTDRFIPEGAGIHIAPTANTSEAKRALLERAAGEQREGIMLRDMGAGYRPGRTSSLLKHKFTKEVDAVVMEVGRGGKDNLVLGAYNDAGELVEIGQVTAIGKGDFVPGDVVETKFLYVTDPAAPRLFQPRILRRRNDKTAAECSMEQLRFAGTNKAITTDEPADAPAG